MHECAVELLQAKLVARIESLRAARVEQDAAEHAPTETAEPAEAEAETTPEETAAEPTASAAEPDAKAEEKKPRGKGVGRPARELILAHPDKSYREIAEMVRAAIPDSNPTEHSVRWYASDMRKGIAGTKRVKAKTAAPAEAVVEAGDSAKAD